MIPKFLQSVWMDPVGSKLIATAITGMVGSLYSGIRALFRNQNFFSGLASFWQFKLPLWIYFVFTVGLVVIFTMLGQRANSTVTSEQLTSDHKPKMQLIFESAQAEPYEYQLNELEGRGTLNVQYGMVTIQRTEDGRVRLRLKKYLNGANKTDYVKSDILGNTKRILDVSFECRVLGGKHTLGIMVERRNGAGLASKIFDVANEDWEPRQIYLQDIPNTEDFVMEFEDAQIGKNNSGIQLRNIKIEEIVNG